MMITEAYTVEGFLKQLKHPTIAVGVARSERRSTVWPSRGLTLTINALGQITEPR